MTTSPDRLDIKILRELQIDADRPVGEIAAKVNLSLNACWRRIRRLEEHGYIRRRVALLDAGKLGVGMTVFVSVRAAEHSEAWLLDFAAAVRGIPEIVELHRTSGETDYILKLLVSDVADYDRVYKRLIRSVRLAEVSSSFSLQEIKATTEVPLPG